MSKPQKNSYIEFIKIHKYTILFILVLMLTFTLRFYNFPERWGLGGDEARDAAIGKIAIERGELPMIGSFSSAGPFVFGPFFYWFIMASYLLLPIFISPWLFVGVVGVVTVAVLMLCAKHIAGNKFALLVGLLAAISPQLISRSFTLGQHSFIALFTSCAILCFLLFIEKKKMFYAFLVGVCIGTAINFHYQALNSLVFLPLLLFVPMKRIRDRIAAFVFASVGVAVALSPLIIWDAQQGFASFNNLFDYFLVGQHRIYVPNSWRLFIFTYLPNYWSIVVGGYSIVALAAMATVGITSLILLIRKKLPRNMLFLMIPFGLLLFLNKFYKGERSEGYLLYLFPFILLITSYIVYVLFQEKHLGKRLLLARRIFASMLLALLIIGSCSISVKHLQHKSANTSVYRTIDRLIKKYPGEKFVVYDYKGYSAYHSQPLSVLLSERKLTDKKGMPIGILCYNECKTKQPKIIDFNGTYIIDLRKENLKTKNPWFAVNPENMYDDLIGWSTRHELRTNFSLLGYVMDKIGLK